MATTPSSDMPVSKAKSTLMGVGKLRKESTGNWEKLEKDASATGAVQAGKTAL